MDELLVEVGGQRERACCYRQLSGRADAGDLVLLNTTAFRLGLGTGGWHFVVAKLPPELPEQSEDPGHVMKLRYTPFQFRCLCAEEPDSPHRAALEGLSGLDGMPVVAASLHSMVAPAAAGAKRAGASRVAYLMTDEAALPLAFSKLVRDLRRAGLIALTITCGQAFGGDLEAVNLYSGLLAAKAAGADLAVVAQGPGNVGTETDWGFGCIAQGEVVNAICVLGGRAVAVPRISFADPRARHRGLSAQAAVALGRVALTPAVVTLPVMEPRRRSQVLKQVESSGIAARHRVVERDGEPALAELERLGLTLTSMGRTIEQDREFFLAAGAAGLQAGEMLIGDAP